MNMLYDAVTDPWLSSSLHIHPSCRPGTSLIFQCFSSLPFSHVLTSFQFHVVLCFLHVFHILAPHFVLFHVSHVPYLLMLSHLPRSMCLPCVHVFWSFSCSSHPCFFHSSCIPHPCPTSFHVPCLSCALSSHALTSPQIHVSSLRACLLVLLMCFISLLLPSCAQTYDLLYLCSMIMLNTWRSVRANSHAHAAMST